MKPLSVFSTLFEAMLLGLQHLWLLMILAVIAAIPLEVLTTYFDPKHPPNPTFAVPVAFVVLIITVIISAMKTAAILGVLKNSQPGLSQAEIVAINIKQYTWTLVRLSLLLALIAFLAWMPLALFTLPLIAMHAHHSTQVALILIAIIYLVFVKFALANPLVVVENMLARPAVHRSWEMTKGHFWYVAFCYLLLAGAQYFITQFSTFIEPANYPLLTTSADNILSNFLDSAWALMGWRMYQLIKAREALSIVAIAGPTQSSPESPSASQSA